MSNIYQRNGQSIAEYATLVAIVIGVVVGVKLFVQRGLQARQYDAARGFLSAVGVNVSDEASMQAEVYTSRNNKQAVSSSDSSKSFDALGTATYSSSQNTRIIRPATETTLAANDYEYYAKYYN